MTIDNLKKMVEGWHKVYCDMAEDTPMKEPYISWSTMCKGAMLEILDGLEE